MAYTITLTDGTLLTTIPDGTINTSNTSLALPGRNFAGYGQYVATDFVHSLENFASTSPPENALVGQLWYDTNISGLRVCPKQYSTNPAEWIPLAQAGGNTNTTFGNITVIGSVTANSGTFQYLTALQSFQSLGLSNIANANIGTLAVSNSATFSGSGVSTNTLSTAGTTVPGTITGNWTFTDSANVSGNLSVGSSVIVTGNVSASGASITGNTTLYNLVVTNSVTFPSQASMILPQNTTIQAGGTLDLRGGNLVTTWLGTDPSSPGAGESVNGNIYGNWTLGPNSHFVATYADLAERFASDAPYDAGTVVELGGIHEITAVKSDLSDRVFGVISTSAAYIMNGAAGPDETHPTVAMTGRVPVKVTGKVLKGDRLVSAGNGIARAALEDEASAFTTIGRALADKVDEAQGTVEAIVTIK